MFVKVLASHTYFDAIYVLYLCVFFSVNA